jgi:hypothetical protein
MACVSLVAWLCLRLGLGGREVSELQWSPHHRRKATEKQTKRVGGALLACRSSSVPNAAPETQN